VAYFQARPVCSVPSPARLFYRLSVCLFVNLLVNLPVPRSTYFTSAGLISGLLFASPVLFVGCSTLIHTGLYIRSCLSACRAVRHPSSRLSVYLPTCPPALLSISRHVPLARPSILLSAYLSVYLPADRPGLPVYLPACTPALLSIFLPVRLPSCLSSCLFTCPPVDFVPPPALPSIFLPVRLPSRLSSCLSASPPVYLPAGPPALLFIFLPVRMPSCLSFGMSAWPACLATCLSVYLLADRPGLLVYLPACKPPYLFVFLPIRLPAYISFCLHLSAFYP
jgi:hypothetical protein